MCTITLIPLCGGGFRLAANRDELRARAPALPPRVFVLGTHPGARRAAWPIDGEAGGTWIAAREDGLTLALLNVNEADAARAAGRRLSRGGIIPAVLRRVESTKDEKREARSDEPAERGRTRSGVNPINVGDPSDRVSDALELVCRAVARLDLPRFDPFRLIGAVGSGVVEARWDGTRLTTDEYALEPMCFTSSGLGDALVRCRLDLWEAWRRDRPATPAMQDEFHRHRWADRPHLSVRMSREDAVTHSVTTVEISRVERGVRMRYSDDLSGHARELRLSSSAAASRVPGAVERASC